MDLSNAKVGDEVRICRSASPDRLAKIDRVTKCYVFAGGSKFHRRTGSISPRPHGYGTSWLAEVTPAAREKVSRERAVVSIRHAVNHLTSRIPTDRLERAAAILYGKGEGN